jgi:hypothetical protein
MSTPAASTVRVSANTPKFSGAPLGSPQGVVVKETSGKAIAALALSIIGLISLLLGIVLGPISICLALQATQEIKAHPNELDGAALAKAAHIIGMVATILSFLWIVIVIVLIASASASGV